MGGLSNRDELIRLDYLFFGCYCDDIKVESIVYGHIKGVEELIGLDYVFIRSIGSLDGTVLV